MCRNIKFYFSSLRPWAVTQFSFVSFSYSAISSAKRFNAILVVIFYTHGADLCSCIVLSQYFAWRAWNVVASASVLLLVGWVPASRSLDSIKWQLQPRDTCIDIEPEHCHFDPYSNENTRHDLMLTRRNCLDNRYFFVSRVYRWSGLLYGCQITRLFLQQHCC